MKESYWIATSKGAIYPPIEESIQAECVIVGGGITGVTTAYLLAKQGKKCVLVDSGALGSGTTGYNTGKVSFLHGITYSEIKHKYGIQRAKAYYDANAQALQLIASTIQEEGISCGFEKVPGYVFTRDRKMLGKIVEEFEVAKELGIPCTLEKALDIPLPIEGALCFENQAQFHPKAYIDQLAAKASALGVQIYEHTPILNIKREVPYTLYTDKNKKIIADQVILCSHFPMADYKPFFLGKLEREKSYIVVGEVKEPVAKGIYVNIEEPKRSFRTVKEENRTLMLIGGQHYNAKQQTLDEQCHYKALKKYGTDVFDIQKYCYEWSAEDYVTVDHLPYIGYVEQKSASFYVATGFSKWGLTNGTVAAMILSDLTLGKDNPFEESFGLQSREALLAKKAEDYLGPELSWHKEEKQ
ncbi:MAG: NAD(P)/FAD-dependent oxidoreductase [Cellulosilyticaceae bacterium]